ncbi:MAG: hypothetical protein ACKN9V_01930 [Pseudomonadota bacterium]
MNRFLVLSILHLSLLGFSEKQKHSVTTAVNKRPTQENKSTSRSWWDLAIGSYQDTITWDVDLVFGKKATDNLAQALLKFFFSPEGTRFIYKNKKSFLESKLEDTGKFEDAFWTEFDDWLKKNGYKKIMDGHLVTAINLLPMQPKLNVTAYYPQTPVRKLITRGVDHIYYLLADDIARTMPGGGLAPKVIANALRRASRGGAILPAVQTSYTQYRNSLTERIINLVGVLAKRLVQQGVEQRNLDLKVDLKVVPWEKTDGFRKNPTFPIRSYFYAANAKKALVPYQVTEFLDSLDQYNFDDEVKEALK